MNGLDALAMAGAAADAGNALDNLNAIAERDASQLAMIEGGASLPMALSSTPLSPIAPTVKARTVKQACPHGCPPKSHRLLCPESLYNVKIEKGKKMIEEAGAYAQAAREKLEAEILKRKRKAEEYHNGAVDAKRKKQAESDAAQGASDKKAERKRLEKEFIAKRTWAKDLSMNEEDANAAAGDIKMTGTQLLTAMRKELCESYNVNPDDIDSENALQRAQIASDEQWHQDQHDEVRAFTAMSKSSRKAYATLPDAPERVATQFGLMRNRASNAKKSRQ
jgi:hypothetical protein